MKMNALDTRVNSLQRSHRRGRLGRDWRTIFLICCALALNGCALFDGMGDSDTSADAGPTDAVSAANVDDADSAPFEDGNSEDAGDAQGVEDTVDESLGQLSFSPELATMQMWVGESSIILNVEAHDWEGERVTLQPGDLRWSFEPQERIALRDCTTQGCKIMAVSAGRTTVYAEVEGFRGTSIEIDAVGWQMVDADARVTCAIDTRGALYCWGVNRAGILGNGVSYGAEVTPQRVGEALEPWQTVSVGAGYSGDTSSAACAVTAAGALYCWGDNTTGRLGDGTNDSRFEPTPVGGEAREWAQVSVGNATTCARTTSAEIYCWGRNSVGETGTDPINGERSDYLIPKHAIAPPATGMWRDVHVSYSSVYARTSAVANTNLYAWGGGYLGGGSSTHTDTPIPIGSYLFEQFETGANHRCGINTSGDVYCWGSNFHRRLIDVNGCAEAPDYSICSPMLMPDLDGVAIDLSVGPTHTCVVLAVNAPDSPGNRIRCWGFNDQGQLGNGEQAAAWSATYAADGQVLSQENWSSVSAGVAHSCAITQEGALFCWGELLTGTANGQPTFETKTRPIKVANPRL